MKRKEGKMGKDKTCAWTRVEFRTYLIFDASTAGVEWQPGCEDSKGTKAWDEIPRFCPWCGRPVKERLQTEKEKP